MYESFRGPWRREQLSAVMGTFSTTMTTVNVHRGSVLPEARVIVIAVPVALFCLYWFVLRKRGRP
jgi:hypothetical protein